MVEMAAKTGIKITDNVIDIIRAGISPIMYLASNAVYGNPRQYTDGTTNTAPETVFMCPNAMKNMASFQAAMLHELAHATGAASRCNRSIMNVQRNPTEIEYAREEIIAESVAASMMRLLGWDTEETNKLNAKYIDDYQMVLMRENVYSHEVVEEMAAEVRKSVDFMMMNWFNEFSEQRQQEAV
jgi:antirestriction protein ArdC